MKMVPILLTMCCAAWGQSQASALIAAAAPSHSAVLTWQDSQNPTGTAYNVYRAPGRCPLSGTPAFVLIAPGVIGLTWTDINLQPGAYCYAVSAVYGGDESDKSVPVDARLAPAVPTGLNVVVK